MTPLTEVLLMVDIEENIHALRELLGVQQAREAMDRKRPSVALRTLYDMPIWTIWGPS